MTRIFDIRRTRAACDPAVAALVARSDEYLQALYPPESNFAASLDRLIADDAAFFIAYVDNKLVACGGVVLHAAEPPYGEVKRVFVDEEQRGKGLATAMMRHLESYIRDSGIGIARLEVGSLQPEAVRLYRRLGYSERGPFGNYEHDSLCLFMEKLLGLAAHPEQ